MFRCGGMLEKSGIIVPLYGLGFVIAVNDTTRVVSVFSNDYYGVSVMTENHATTKRLLEV